jgi:hypothetical protein
VWRQVIYSVTVLAEKVKAGNSRGQAFIATFQSCRLQMFSIDSNTHFVISFAHLIIAPEISDLAQHLIFDLAQFC